MGYSQSLRGISLPSDTMAVFCRTTAAAARARPSHEAAACHRRTNLKYIVRCGTRWRCVVDFRAWSLQQESKIFVKQDVIERPQPKLAPAIVLSRVQKPDGCDGTKFRARQRVIGGSTYCFRARSARRMCRQDGC